MTGTVSRPRLRPVDCVVVPDPRHGKVLVLRDTEGVASSDVVVPPHVGRVLGLFDGTRSIERIAREASGVGSIDVTNVEQLARELDAALLLDTPRYRARKAELVEEFRDAKVRAATHAGGAYHGDSHKLTTFIQRECFAKAPAPKKTTSPIRALVAPHMDLWRAAAGYGHAYRPFESALAPVADTFVLLGTSHAPMRRPFAICRKAFDTPLGKLEPDGDAIDELAAASRFDVYADEYLHKREHSLEFQAVFLRHALGLARSKKARIIPILCGLGEAQSRGTDPMLDADAASLLDALRRLVTERGERVVVIAGADLAHVGPRFGDARPLDTEGRGALEARDAESIDLALAGATKEFFAQVASDLDTRRVCGLGPIYTLLAMMSGGGLRGDKLHYAQHVDPDEGSIVSHTSLAFYG